MYASSAGYLNPGTVVSVPVDYYGVVVDHVGIISDWRGRDGPGVIHSSKQASRTVVETSWTEFLQGKVPGSEPAIVQGLRPKLPVDQVIHRARSKRGTAWNLISSNCEHFVRWALGYEEHEVVSPQLAWWVGGLLFVGAVLTGVVLLLRGK